MRELEDLGETHSEYRERGEDSDSQSERLLEICQKEEEIHFFCRDSMMSGSDFTSFTVDNMSEYSERRAQKNAELAERA